MLTARFFRTETPNLVKFLTRSSSRQGRSTSYNVGSVLWRLFSTLEVVQCIGEITSVQWGIASVLWRVFSTVGDTFSTVGDNISTVGHNISTVEVAQYSGDKDLKYDEFSKNLEIFSRAYFPFEIRSATSQDSIADHG